MVIYHLELFFFVLCVVESLLSPHSPHSHGVDIIFLFDRQVEYEPVDDMILLVTEILY